MFFQHVAVAMRKSQYQHMLPLEPNASPWGYLAPASSLLKSSSSMTLGDLPLQCQDSPNHNP